ncbi:MAG: hypothetical protein B9S32_16580 [Verrucomicrobia bacterium Tous-C9LFEB]|nr:MAG: hypothetical protein B9S32_16580 [Verrucomicrobia bacterium Tous-C9LFEB]
MALQSESLTKQNFVFAQLHNRIATGVWGIGDQIPTEEELATEFQCSRGTVGRAVARLVQEKLVERRTRSGTRVIRTASAANPSSLDLDACAFIYPGDQHVGGWRMLRGFQQAAFAAKRRTLTLSAGTDFRKEAEIVGRLAEFNVKGAVLFPVITNPEEMAYYSQMILSCPFPVVLLELNLPGMRRPAVVVDGLHAGYTMTKHLLDQGLRRIGFFSHYAWTPFIRDRYLGYRQALEEAGVAENEKWVMLESEMNPNFVDPIDEPRRMAESFLSRKMELEGIVCSSDNMAVGMLQALRDRGIAIPGPVKVTGMDDCAVAAASPIPLTTYRVPYEAMGLRAFECLNVLMHGEPLPVSEVQLRGEFVPGQTG